MARGAQAASLDPEKVSAGHRQLSQLEDYLKDLDKVDNPQQLFEFVCSLKGPMAEKSKGTVVRLALRLGLEGVSSKEEFLEALEPMPTEESVRRIYEFIANQVRDAALRPLEKNPKILRIAEKQLSVPEFKSALAIHRGGSRFHGGSPDLGQTPQRKRSLCCQRAASSRSWRAISRKPAGLTSKTS